ncbi:MAG: NAD(P)H-dependent oxidoreductase subunit E [Candidatus Nitricoxidivorans perseverans]|uniref:NAD(P)H-dependent oxidoreductase subunit E n=1 Tax=Candidatus Nitricoxidivorans perseverans TaxID=2975601 RepID=A0AA49FMZ8_9PROT|nr:MAG: NAD(P)H-dependent oxidoreductase subunit E [Candidatus Nitricoxidivorans perseverans]
MHSETLAPILERHRRDGTRLVQILREVQDVLGWLPPEAITEIAAATAMPRVRVESTAGFYGFFHTRPMGRYRVLWSDNVTDRMLGSRELMRSMCEKLWLEPGRVSEDGLVSVDATSCTGMGDQGPAILVNGRAITRMTPRRVEEIVGLIQAQAPLADWPAEFFAVEDNIRRTGALLDHGLAPGEALAAALERGPAALIDEIKASGLRGRGGAGFSTGLKWEACRNAPRAKIGDRPQFYESQNRGLSPIFPIFPYVVCNADEGEPGTFKDRVLLTRHADLVFEGMAIAGLAVGATRGLLYLRGEYRYLLEPLEAVLARRRAAGLPGNFDIEIHLGAGAYICGEESALIESLEGKPGRPRIRPPFPVTRGYLGQPTTVNNVETLAAACLVARHGGAWYAKLGTAKSAGTKLLSVSGDVARPGIYEYPFGATVAEVLADCGTDGCSQAVQVSGPSGVTLSPDEYGRRLAFEDVPTAGSLMVFDCRRDMFEVARNFVRFFAHESCGFCTPCRVGTALAAKLMDKIAAGHGSPYDLDELSKLRGVMRGASHCGLGNSASNAIADTLAKFRPAYERRLMSSDYEPAFDLDAALSQARQMTGRDDRAAHLEESS